MALRLSLLFDRDAELRFIEPINFFMFVVVTMLEAGVADCGGPYVYIQTPRSTRIRAQGLTGSDTVVHLQISAAPFPYPRSLEAHFLPEKV